MTARELYTVVSNAAVALVIYFSFIAVILA